LRRAEAAFDENDLRESIRQARRAASLTAPGTAHVRRAFARLVVIARGAEASGQLDVAELAWQAVRAAALEGADPWSGTPVELDYANRSLARLGARRLGAERAGDLDATERELLRGLERPAAPRAARLSLLGAGFVLAALGLGWAALRGVGESGRVIRRELGLGLAVATIGAACWTLAVFQA
jgi:hypothetical protein